MDMQLERLSQRYENVIKIEKYEGISNNESTQFKLYFKNYIEIITITPNREPHDTNFRLVNVHH